MTDDLSDFLKLTKEYADIPSFCNGIGCCIYDEKDAICIFLWNM